MLRISEVAATFDVSRNTVGKWIRTGVLEVVKVGSVVRVTRASFEKLTTPGQAQRLRG